MPRRDGLYPARMSLSLSAESMNRLKRTAKKYDIAYGVLARWAIDFGLKAAGDRARREASERASLAASNGAHDDT